MNLKQEAKSEKEKLKYMSWKDRIWYVWEYYKFHMLLVLIAFVILWVIVTSLYRQSFTTRLSMAIINDRSGGASSTAPLMEGLRNALNCQKKTSLKSMKVSILIPTKKPCPSIPMQVWQKLQPWYPEGC